MKTDIHNNLIEFGTHHIKDWCVLDVVGDSIKISTVKLPDGVKPTITDRDFTIATIAAPTKMAEVSTETVEETEEETSEASDTNEENKDTNTEN